MRVCVALLLVIVTAKAASIASDYLPPIADNSLPVQEYIQADNKKEPATLTANGYRYKVVRKLKQRLRRDVNELQPNEYLPPLDKNGTSTAQSVAKEASLGDATPEEKTLLAEDGYRYKTVRRLKYRQRRDVNELPTKEYLPPTEVVESVPLVADEVSVVEAVPEVKTDLAEDGYRYKTVRRLIYRQRRDVNELPAKEYLSPTDVEQPVSEEVSVVEAVPEVKNDLAEDGYRYKTFRRLIYRQRRDVSELPTKEYLPPTKVEQPVSEEISVVESVPEVKTDLAEDGYRYKTVRRLKYRQRRDVSELPAKEYLPPNKVDQRVAEEVSVVESVPEVKTDLAEDGYRYKTVRRLVYRQRRDVSELPAKEYLPPTKIEQPVSEEISIVESAPEVRTDLAEDGYRYKTVRRLKYRQRRDVSELPTKEYLPPTEIKSAAPVETEIVEPSPEVKTVLADDGYHYKTVRRLKYRRL